MADTILITGAAGGLGSKVIDNLARSNGIKIRAAMHHPDKAKSFNWPDVDVVGFDYNSPGNFEGIFDGIDKLFLVAPPISNDNDKLLNRAVDAAIKAGVKMIVSNSAMGLDKIDNPMKRVENHIEETGIKHIFVRPNWYMQNFVTFLKRTINQQNGIFLPAGDSKISFIDTRDVAEAVAKILADNGNEKKVYTLTGGEALDHHQVAEKISEVAGREIKYVPISEEDARKGMLDAGVPSPIVEGTLGLYRMVREGLTTEVTDDVKRLLGRDPKSFEQFAKDYAGQWKVA
jgi:uncharacterized protein YbjT (DUF2867 family)